MRSQKTANYLQDAVAKRSYNRWLFGIVAKRYSFVTHALSLGRDAHWKKWLVSHIPGGSAPCVIDIASGNGDLAFALLRKFPDAHVAGADLTPEMFGVARNHRHRSRISFVRQDMSQLGFKSARTDIVTGGYALRNAPDLEKTLCEVRRVLRTGGTAAFLEFSKPASRAAAFIEHLLLAFWGGLWGFLLHGRPEIYAYIAESLRVFPDRPSLHALMASHGLPVTQSKLFFFGVMEAIVCTAAEPLSETCRSHPRNR
jgi:ubiquinone/menaquinone biosynthesis methyltransferase